MEIANSPVPVTAVLYLKFIFFLTIISHQQQYKAPLVRCIMKTDLIRFSVRHVGIFLMSDLFGRRLHPMLVYILNITQV